MNRWIAALAMGLATAANAPAAAPPGPTHDVIPTAHDVISTAEAAPRSDGARVEPAALVFDRHASLTTEGEGASLASNGPDPVVAWLLAAGFLGIIVLRRTRASQFY